MTSSNEIKTLSPNSPARFGAYLGLALAATMLGYALWMLATSAHNPMPFKIAFLAAGIVQGASCLYSLYGYRSAWSFALALNGTLAVVFLFGAPKVRDGWDISMGIGFLPFVMFALTTALLAASSDEF